MYHIFLKCGHCHAWTIINDPTEIDNYKAGQIGVGWAAGWRRLGHNHNVCPACYEAGRHEDEDEDAHCD